MIDVTGAGYESKGDFLLEDVSVIDAKDDFDLTLMLKASTLCVPTLPMTEQKCLGDTTEGALIVAAAKAGIE